MRFVDYKLENGSYLIRNRATKNEGECPLTNVPEWADITEELRIANVDRLPVAILRCPINKRTSSNVDGVPITYGSEALIGQIYECLNQIQREYDLKQAFVGVDSAMFDTNNRLPNGGLFKTFIGDTGEFWQVFDPLIRDNAYLTRLQSLFELLEKSVGTSKGILTAPEAATTATEIRRATYDTWTIVNAVRKQVEYAAEALVYAYDLLCNAYNLAPQGEYEIRYDWDYSLIENTMETFSQLMQAHSVNAIDEVTIRQFVIPSESLEEAEKAVEKIKQQSPSASRLIGEA
jgi:hypothetical protein